MMTVESAQSAFLISRNRQQALPFIDTIGIWLAVFQGWQHANFRLFSALNLLYKQAKNWQKWTKIDKN